MTEIERVAQQFRDHRTFAEESLKVRHKSGRIVPYQFAPSQEKFNASIDRQAARERPIRQVWLKSRQVYGSTTVAGRFFHDLAFHTGRHARVIAHEASAAGDIFDYYKTFDEHYEAFGGIVAKSKLVQDSQNQIKWANDSWARILTAGNLKTGRSATVSLFHCSEMAFWPNATTLFRGILGSCPETPDTAIIVESTAFGVGNEFHQLCMKAMDPTQDVWEFVFFAWWEHPEYSTAVRGDRAQFQDALSQEELFLRERYNLTLDQLQWRRDKIETFKGDVDGFRQEFPSNPEEAFITSGRPRFSMIDLRAMPVIEDAPCGELEETDYGPHKMIRFLENEAGRGAFTVYRKPSEGRLYVVGADTAQGIDANEGKGTLDPDYSVACVLDADSGEQVAKFRARVEPEEFARYLGVIGKYYGWAYIVPEANGPGLATIQALLRGIPNPDDEHKPLSLGYPPDLIYKRSGTAYDEIEGRRAGVNHYGYLTTTASRPILLSNLANAIRERSITLRDPHTVQEHLTFYIAPSGKPKAQPGCHDDEVIAAGLAIVGMQAYPDHLRRKNQPMAAKPYRSSAESVYRRRRA